MTTFIETITGILTDIQRSQEELLRKRALRTCSVDCSSFTQMFRCHRISIEPHCNIGRDRLVQGDRRASGENMQRGTGALVSDDFSSALPRALLCAGCQSSRCRRIRQRCQSAVHASLHASTGCSTGTRQHDHESMSVGTRMERKPRNEHTATFAYINYLFCCV